MQFSTAGWFAWGMVLLMIWSLVWKGLALWHAARREEKPWFIVLLIVNTVGILEIIYLVFVARLFDEKKAVALKPQRKQNRK